MSVESDIARIIEQERAYVFERFDEDTAFAIGAHVREAARALGKGIAVGVLLWDRTMFYGTTAGIAWGNEPWVRRKVGTVRLMLKSSYRVVLERGDKPRVLEESWAQDVRDYALAGGAFPITLKGFGIVGAVATSGLSERLDHNLSAAAIASALGIDAMALALAD
jgi:uncharacterized protein (UPF0303 family)